jgi:hypothetical protein
MRVFFLPALLAAVACAGIICRLPALPGRHFVSSHCSILVLVHPATPCQALPFCCYLLLVTGVLFCLLLALLCLEVTLLVEALLSSVSNLGAWRVVSGVFLWL